MTRLTCQSSRTAVTPLTPTATTPTSSISSRQTLRDLSAAQQIAELKKELIIVKAERDAANVHAVISGQEAAVWKHRYNKKAVKKDTTKRFTTDARIVTSREGREEAVADAAKKAAKKQAEAEKIKKKQDLEREDILRRAAQEKESIAFSGSLKSKSKRDLIDIAFSLNVETDGATADVLRSPRYIDLFTCKRKRHDLSKDNEPGHATGEDTIEVPEASDEVPSVGTVAVTQGGTRKGYTVLGSMMGLQRSFRQRSLHAIWVSLRSAKKKEVPECRTEPID
ncbi:hypothetical protein DFH05DRAFT_1559026 [Lentinula detonsa]|uniref:Uncharacterized protein n=1 Tax=Lentinula detonsa TaxID=2804962 RepID=A0A9W8NWF0_9AGAR|nr:hypothetical protein DFH05DRAFT_1559026 [Lentinula detonsa]